MISSRYTYAVRTETGPKGTYSGSGLMRRYAIRPRVQIRVAVDVCSGTVAIAQKHGQIKWLDHVES